MDGYVSKPIRAQELYQAIEGAVAAPAQAPPPAANGPVDWDAALAQAAGDAGLLRELIVLFLRESPGWRKELRVAQAEGKAAAVAQAAHHLKSPLAALGAAAAATAANRVEVLGRQGDLDQAREAVANLEAELDRVETVLAAGPGRPEEVMP